MKFASASLVCLLACASAAFAAPQAQDPPATSDTSAAAPAPAPLPPPVYPHVTLETNKGNIVLELYTDKAPKTVENFLTYVKAGHYNNTIFHRVIPDFMIQAGGFDLEGNMKSTREPVMNEADNRIHNTRGTVAMARTGDPHSAKSQFFVNLKDNGFLNHTGKNPAGWGYCVFGQVIEGMETVDAIAAVATNKPGKLSEAQPIEPVIILKAYSDVKEKEAPAAKSKAPAKGKSKTKASAKAKPKPPAPK